MGTVSAYMDAELAEERTKIVLQLNEQTLARHVTYRVREDSLKQAVAAADALNGELVAALAIRTEPDTLWLEPTSTETQFDITSAGVTRTASLTDTTDMGIEVTVTAEAPPAPAKLKLGMRVIVPEFRPEIAFIENADGIFASVSWANQKFQVEAPYYRPSTTKQKPLRLIAGTDVLIHQNVDPSELLAAAIYLEAQYRTPQWEIGVPVGLNNIGLYTGLGVRRTLGEWSGVLDLLWPF